MFNSKSFCIIITLTAVILGGAVFLQVKEMQEYKLLTKLYNQYFGGSSTAEAPAAPAAKTAEKK
jgi:hypothetical protein